MDGMTNVPTFRLDRRTVLHLAPDQSASPFWVDEDTWTRQPPITELREGRIMSIFAYEGSWTWWERHPVGAELVRVLSGAVVFHLEGDDGSRSFSAALQAGDCLLVPQGSWHRAEIAEPSTMLFVTPTPALTEHRDA